MGSPWKRRIMNQQAHKVLYTSSGGEWTDDGSTKQPLINLLGTNDYPALIA
jgi:hypothetical protein